MNQYENFVGAFPTERRAVLYRPGGSDKWARVARSSPGSDASHRRPGVVSNRQGFPHFVGRVGVKKLVQDHKIRLATWNIGSLTGKLVELVDVMCRRKIDILCLQETKWVGEKAKVIEPWGYKIWYTGINKNRNGVGIVMSREFIDNVVEVRRKGDRILLIKLVLGTNIINIISVYAPQVGLDDSIKRQFWEDLDGVVQGISYGERLFIGGDLNGHVGISRDGFESIHGGYGIGERNESGERILDFGLSYDMILANTWFRKRESHLVTFKSGVNTSQIDFFLLRKRDRGCCIDCKVIPGESVATQHRVLILDLRIRQYRKRDRHMIDPRIKWWALKEAKQGMFVERVVKEVDWCLEEDSESMWNKIAGGMRKVAKEVLGESKGGAPLGKDTSWWNEDVKLAIKVKRECYRNLSKNRDNENLEKYMIAKKEAKKVVRNARDKVYKEVYDKLDTKEGEKDIYRLAKMRDRKSRDLGMVRCIKDETQRVLVKDEEIKERWKDYFDKLFNESHAQDLGDFSIPFHEMNRDFMRKIQKKEIAEALKKMKSRRAVGPDGIPIEAWKCLGEKGLEWLTNLFNKIWRTNKMPNEWRKSTLVPLYKNKGDIQDCTNYRGIKLMSHTMKLWERVIESRLRKIVMISENQFGFMPGRSTMEAIHLLRQLIERNRERNKDLHMVFIDLEKAYDRVPRDVLWWTMMKKGVSLKYISIIKDMYEGVVTNVRTCGGVTTNFPITVGLHQGSALSPFLFAIVMDELTRSIQENVPWCMLFADDIVLIDESRAGVNAKLELWRQTLEARGFKLSKSKTEYMECRFSKQRSSDGSVVKLGEHEIPVDDSFKYLGSIIQKYGEIDGDVNHRIKVGWMKWKSATEVLCDRRMPLRLKGKFYRTTIRPALLYSTECWAAKRHHIQKMSVAEMRMLRWMCGNTIKDKIRNEEIRKKVGVAPIENKMRENRLRWFGHIRRRPNDAPVRRMEKWENILVKRGRGRPRKTWMEVIRKDMNALNLTEDMALDRNEWRRRIHVEDP
jgi:hypothetical protein